MTLAEEIRLGETQSLEFKRIPTVDRIKYQKTAVAFANGRGGRILFGVANDRTVIGVSRDALFTEMDAIVNSISDACEPKIPLDVSIEDIEGKAVINYMRYVEGWGSGYKRVDEQLAAAGISAASMEVSNGSVRVDVCRKTKGDEQIKSSIGTKESAIEAKKSAIESLLSSFQLTRPTHDNIVELYLALDENEIFGRQTIMKITGLSSSAAGTFLSGVLNLGILDHVTGHGKGRYRFRKP